MTANTEGWSWLEPLPAADDEASGQAREEGREDVAMTYARCFRTAEGQRVLEHLRRLTLDRTVGPATPNEVLRHLEGQRALVAHILSLVARGNLNQ